MGAPAFTQTARPYRGSRIGMAFLRFLDFLAPDIDHPPGVPKQKIVPEEMQRRALHPRQRQRAKESF